MWFKSKPKWPHVKLVSAIMIVTESKHARCAPLAIRSLLGQNNALIEIIAYNATDIKLKGVREIRLKPMLHGDMLNLCLNNIDGDIVTVVYPDALYHPDYAAQAAADSAQDTIRVLQNKRCYDMKSQNLVAIDDNRVWVPAWESRHTARFNQVGSISHFTSQFSYVKAVNNSGALVTKYVSEMK